MNKLKCGECKNYFGMERPLRRKEGGTVSLKKGYCLAKSVFASNRPGDEILPPGAKTAELEYGRHKIHLVREEEIVPHCVPATKR